MIRVGSLIKVGFIGHKTEDIMMYLSRIILNMGKRVAVFDASNEQILRYYAPNIDESSNVTNYRNIDFYSSCQSIEAHCKIEFSKYDVVLINYGYNTELLDEYSSCSHKFIVTDLERHSILKMKNTCSKLNKSIEIFRVFRDVVNCKIDEKYINNVLDNVMVKILNDYIIFHDDNELICKIESQYNDIFKFNKLPKFFKDILLDILNSLGFDKKSSVKALKISEKGV